MRGSPSLGLPFLKEGYLHPVDLRNLIIGLLLVGLLAWGFAYLTRDQEQFPGEMAYREGNYRLQRGEYEKALACFKQAETLNPSFKPARLGQALVYIEIKEYARARQILDRLLAEDPSFAEAWANRGILNDREGRYKEAMHDYRQALRLNPDLAKAPGFLYRLIHNVQEKPSTIADRLRYLEEEFKKPPGKRVLRVPEIDEKQPVNTPGRSL